MPLRKFTLVFTSLASAVLSTSSSRAQKLTYDDHILPILETSCTNCHNPDKQKGGLDLTSYRGLITGGSGGKIAIAGDGADSKIYTTSAHLVEPLMPPEGERLGKKQLNTIRAWIDGGLLETMDSVAKKDDTPKIDFSQLETSKPSGPPPMPANVSTDPVVLLQRTGAISALASSPWAPLVAIASEQQILLYNTDNFDLEAVLPFEKGNPESLSFHPSGKYLLAGGGYQGKSGTTATYDVTDGSTIMKTSKEYDSVIASSLRSDLKAVATSGPSKLIKMWQTADNSLQFNIKKHTDWVTNVSYSPDGVLLATADRNGGLMIWEAETGNEFHNLSGHSANITSLKWSVNSNYLASASEDGTFRIWDMNSGNEIKKVDAHKPGILSLDWAKSGEIITTGRDNLIKIWKPDYNLLKEIKYELSLPTQVSWSHDAKRFISSDYRGIITIWDSKTYSKITELAANPTNLADRLILAQNQLAEFQKIAATKLANYQQISNRRQQLEAKIKENNNLIETSRTTVAKVKQGIDKDKKEMEKNRGERNQLNKKQQNLEKSRRQLNDLNKELQESNNRLKKLTDDIAKSEASILAEPDNQDFKNTLKNLQAKHQSESAKAAKVQQKIAANQDAQQLQTQTDELRNQLAAKDTAIQNFQKQIEQGRQEIDKTNKQSQKLRAEIPKLKNELKPLPEAEKSAQQQVDDYSKTVKPAQEKLDRLQARSK